MLTNHLLSSLNEIRQCAPYELRGEILRRLTKTLRGAVGVLAQAVTLPLHCRYIAVTLPVHCRYV